MGLHGGGYDSRYFDAPGSSLLSRAATAGFPALAITRPGHPADEESARRQPPFAEAASIIAEAIADAWQQFGDGRPGVVLLGHSIGGAIGVHIAAARTLTWPLFGLTVSGVGDVISLRAMEQFTRLPPGTAVDFPFEAMSPVHHRLGDAYVRAVLVFAERCAMERRRPAIVSAWSWRQGHARPPSPACGPRSPPTAPAELDVMVWPRNMRHCWRHCGRATRPRGTSVIARRLARTVLSVLADVAPEYEPTVTRTALGIAGGGQFWLRHVRPGCGPRGRRRLDSGMPNGRVSSWTVSQQGVEIK
ncbi:alpha/beta fold hydrolase [Streptomyces sp. BV286]|uniref:alpha/beta fold hydrolase n=1 Tax=Streptomyces sp. BV286 TaxID=2849672 RepID=UPI001C2E085E|nr:alpha/beta fold hydrolase [Streptomyces sp. BV286]MBV1942565.1 alpha/beta fold hydrolase [Streptomyces sp. BV286]